MEADGVWNSPGLVLYCRRILEVSSQLDWFLHWRGVALLSIGFLSLPFDKLS